MRLTVRDGLATVFVAAALAVYLLWVSGAAMTGWSVRVAAACSVWGGPPALLIRSRWPWSTGPPTGAGDRRRLTWCSCRASARWRRWPGATALGLGAGDR